MEVRPKILSSCREITTVVVGWQQLIAISNECCISVIEPKSQTILQSLQRHTFPITHLTWAPENFFHDAKNPYSHRLASADSSGRIIIWNVISANPLAEAIESGYSVCAMHWISDQDISRDLLLVLHSNSTLILLNAQTCMPLWKKLYSSSIDSLSFDPFSSRNLILYGFNHFILVSDFSWNSAPESTGKQILFLDQVSSNENDNSDPSGNRLSRTIKAIATTVINKNPFRPTRNRRNIDISSKMLDSGTNERPMQILYHGFRKNHIVIVYAREIIFFDLVLSLYVGAIRLSDVSASLVQAYCCRQADALICLHQNGTVSLHCWMPIPPSTSTDEFPLVPHVDFNYRLICESKYLRRGRNFHVVGMAVDPGTELTVTVATSDGRLQLLSIVPGAIPAVEGWAYLTLLDMVKVLDSSDFTDETSPLRFRFTGFYCGGSPTPTVCAVCPSNFLLPLPGGTKPRSLIAVGTMRGSVQIWDAFTSRLWREYHVINAPVRGLTWGLLPPEGEKPGSLTLFVYGWQTSDTISYDGGGGSPQDASKVVKNTVVRVDLETGQQRHVLTQQTDAKDLQILKLAMQKPSSMARPSQWLNIASELSDFAVANMTPIRSMKMSNLGQYLAILFENSPLEIWDARKLILLKSFPIKNSRPVALTWSTVNSSGRAPSSPHDGIVPENLKKSQSSNLSVNSVSSEAYLRETFILCTTPVSLQLFTMEGSNMDAMPISDIIVQSLPHHSRNGITCATWRSPLIAFGMADGCVAVRNLQTKETIARSMAVLIASDTGFSYTMPVADSIGVTAISTSDFNPISSGSGVGSLGTSGDLSAPSCVKKIEFLPTRGSSCCLLVLCNSCVAVWHAKQMVLLCVARFSNSPQKVLIDAAWMHFTPLSDTTGPMCVFLALDGSIRLATTGSAVSNQLLIEGQGDASPVSLHEYLPISGFDFGSPYSPETENTDIPLTPSLLPLKVALTLRHLLQNQPWRSHSSDCRGILSPESTVKGFVLSCPKLSANFSKVQFMVDQFFSALQKDKPLCTVFESNNLSIAERCLLTALLFGDAYEMTFWRVASYRLLLIDLDRSSTLNPEGPSHRHRQRFSLTDLVWDELTERETYRATVMARVNRLIEEVSTPEQNHICTQQLLLLGYQGPAIRQLAEEPADSASFSLGIHRACLLATHGYIQELESIAAGACGSTATPLVEKMNYVSSVKLLAANLVSNNRLHEGVELLCMLGLNTEACRYLETYNEWETAVWLAKCTLSEEECEGVMRRWALHLASQANRKTMAILVLVYLGQHETVLNLLQGLRQHQLAARYLEACLECNALTSDTETEKLHSQVFLEFARVLTDLGHKDSAMYYAKLAGELGEPLRNEIDFLLN